MTKAAWSLAADVNLKAPLPAGSTDPPTTPGITPGPVPAVKPGEAELPLVP